MIGHWEMLLRITVAAFLGGVIGVERDIHRRQAGFRTHLIVSMASGTFMVVSAHFVHYQNYVAGSFVAVDPSRIAASVVAGVGFLAGGSILRTGATVQGLTTAAGLWLVAAIGLCAGAGMYPESVFVTILGLVAMTVFRVLEDKNVVRRNVVLGFHPTVNLLTSARPELELLGAQILALDYHKDVDGGRASLSFDLLLPESLGLPRLISTLEALEGVREIQVRVP